MPEYPDWRMRCETGQLVDALVHRYINEPTPQDKSLVLQRLQEALPAFRIGQVTFKFGPTPGCRPQSKVVEVLSVFLTSKSHVADIPKALYHAAGYIEQVHEDGSAYVLKSRYHIGGPIAQSRLPLHLVVPKARPTAWERILAD